MSLSRHGFWALFLASLIFASTPMPVRALGGQYGVEWAIDAPWRLEPHSTGSGRWAYGAIPIVIEFDDANFEVERNDIASIAISQIFIGSAKELRIREFNPETPDKVEAETIIPVEQFTEIEQKRKMSTKQKELGHKVCRPAFGQDCSNVLDITDAHEWHAAVWFTPKRKIFPGQNILLQVTFVTQRHPMIGDAVPIPGAGPLIATVLGDPKSVTTLEWTNYLAIHAGEAPLPRFANEWLYGDFHYHSQGTDNEGETGYAFRNVPRALGASGMDFVFTTDHASSSTQQASKDEARDLNPARFIVNKEIVYGPEGANAQIANEVDLGTFARVKDGNVLPQIYMGEEVDVQPEISEQEYKDGYLYYGDHQKYSWFAMANCSGVKPEDTSTNGDVCRRVFSKPVPGSPTHLLLDEQGALRPSPHGSRQHQVYFPVDTTSTVTGFIGSDTSDYGGGTKRLSTVIAEIERGGVAFLAHPLEGAHAESDHAPDIVPYSDFELMEAWRSKAILGLQFWNENAHNVSETNDPDDVMNLDSTITKSVVSTYRYDYRWPYRKAEGSDHSWHWHKTSLWKGPASFVYQGSVTWDRYLRMGLDPEQTAQISWLTKGEPRKWFAAGGSDSHGDFNYRRHGRVSCFNHLERWCEKKISDTAIGNPRNLISMIPQASVGLAGADSGAAAGSGPRRYRNTQVIDAIKTGQFSVTDGPAVRIVVDKNRNGVIEGTDYPMGSVVDFYPGEYIPLLVEWISTPEFGPIEKVDLYIGNQKVTFAPENHGPIIVADYPGGDPHLGAYTKDPSGALQVKFASNLATHAEPVQFHGVARVFIGPGQFQLAETDGGLFYARAVVKTVSAHTYLLDSHACDVTSAVAGTRCGDRWALTNPVWGRYHTSCPAKPAGAEPASHLPPVSVTQARPSTALDSNANGYPDICEQVVEDACAAHPETPISVTNNGHVEGVGGMAGGPAAGRRSAGGTSSGTRAGAQLPQPTQGVQPSKPGPNTSCQKVVAL